MNSQIKDALEQILMHLNKGQGSDFRKAYDPSMKPKPPMREEDALHEALEGEDSPKGIAIEKVEVMKPESEEGESDMPMSDEEREELQAMLDEMMNKKEI